MIRMDRAMITELPTELIQRIFSQFNDLDTLKAAAVCCRTFHLAFAGLEERLTTEILLKQIHPTVFTHAVAVHVSSGITGGTAAVSNFSELYLKSKPTPPATWKLADALPLTRFHAIVDYFATRLSHTALQRAPNSLKEPPQPRHPTDTEVRRVQRALYCYQLYCNLFSTWAPNEDEQRELFFSYFSTWENEQLSCVHDLLNEFISNSFNDLVDHDVLWGSGGVDYLTKYTSDSRGEYILALGLAHLHKIARAHEFYEKRKLLSDQERGELPGILIDFLYDGLVKGGSPDWEDEWRSLCDLDEATQASFIGKPQYDEPDPGPLTAWNWVYGEDLPGRLVGQSWKSTYRLWGYVFWDMSRLQLSGVLDSECGDVEVVVEEVDKFESPERLQVLKESQERRRAIRQERGSGWWSAEDETQVVYVSATGKVISKTIQR